jgi:hypothetical protein
MRAALSKRVQENSFRVIPILLPGADQEAKDKLPSFLLRFTWVDFSAGIDDPVAFSRLVAGIRGQAPGRSGVQKLSAASPYVRKSVREIMADVLRQEGIDLASMPLGVGATIKTIIRRCQLQYPDLDPGEVARKVNAGACRRLRGEICAAQPEGRRALPRLRGVGVRVEHAACGMSAFATWPAAGRSTSASATVSKSLSSTRISGSWSVLICRQRRSPGPRKVIANLDTRRAEAEELQGVASHAFDLYLSLRTYQSSFFDVGDALFAACRVLDNGGRAVISIPYIYVDQGRLLNGLLRPGGHDLDPDLPYEIADAVRRGLQNLGFEQLGMHTGLFEIYVYGTKTS